MATIAAIHGTTVTLTSPLQNNHLGARDASGTLVYLPQVVDMTRNLLVASQNPAGTRGYVYLIAQANVHIANAVFSNLGRTTVNTLDDTTFGPSGNVTHIGTNQDDRYAVYLDNLEGATQTPANGYQYAFTGNVITNQGSATPLEKWGLAIENSSYGLIQGNVVENVGGAGFATTTGSESFNLFQANFAAVISAPGPSDNTDISDGGNIGRDGAGFWLRGQNNYVVNNVAADSALGFQYMAYRLGSLSIPRFAGANYLNPADMQTVNFGTLPILQFQGNEAYGAMNRALDIWEIGSFGEILYAVPESTIQSFSAWNIYRSAISIYRAHFITFNDVVVLGNVTKDTRSVGINLSSQYRERNLTVTNSEFEGLDTGVLIDTPMIGATTVGSIFHVNLPQTVPGVITVASSTFACYTAIQINSDRFTGYASAPRQILIQNDRFANVKNAKISGLTQSFIDMNYQTVTNLGGGTDLTEKDQVQVQNFNDVVGDNFNLFYLQQAANFIVPETNAIPGLQGAPVAGLTNQQTWTKYHLAIAGAVAPTNTTMANIVGVVQSF